MPMRRFRRGNRRRMVISKRPIDKQILQYSTLVTEAMQDNQVIWTTTYPATLVGIMGQVILSNGTVSGAAVAPNNTQIRCSLAMQIVRHGLTPSNLTGGGALTTALAPEQNCLVFFQSAVEPSSVATGPALSGTNRGPTIMSTPFQTKTKRKLMEGDQIYFSIQLFAPGSAGQTVVADVYIQFFLLS